MAALYDIIGLEYANLRRPDPRIAAAIHRHLPETGSLLNLGAGTGNYEPVHLAVTAVEPSTEMIRQRTPQAAPVIQASAEDLPFESKSFDAAMALLTVHHWQDVARGLAELKRVTRGAIVIHTFDPHNASFWLNDYMPELLDLDRGQMPSFGDFEEILGDCARYPVLIPKDCTDGFLCAYWQRPEAYLDPKVRQSISSFAKIGDVSGALARLEDDLASGAWTQKYGHFLEHDPWDFGYYLVVSR